MRITSNKHQATEKKGDRAIATQTDTQRKAAAQKAAATRRRNAANRSRSARKAAETRTRAEANVLQSMGLQAQRAADTAVGAAFTASDNVAGAIKPLRTQSGARRQLSRVQGRLTANLRKAERRGAAARKRFQRTATRQRNQVTRVMRRNRREARHQVKSTRDGVERRFGDAQATTEDLLRRVESEARNLA